METFLIEIFTKFFLTSGSPLLVFLTPVLAPVFALATFLGGMAVIVIPFVKALEMYEDSEIYARYKERAYRRSLQKALDLWQHGYIEYYVGDFDSIHGKYHYIERKENHEGDRYWKESLLKAHKAHTLGMVACKRRPSYARESYKKCEHF